MYFMMMGLYFFHPVTLTSGRESAGATAKQNRAARAMIHPHIGTRNKYHKPLLEYSFPTRWIDPAVLTSNCTSSIIRRRCLRAVGAAPPRKYKHAYMDDLEHLQEAFHLLLSI